MPAGSFWTRGFATPAIPLAPRRGQPPAVGTERHTRDALNVAAQDTDLLAGLRVPDVYLSIGKGLRIARSRGQLFPVVAESHAHDRCGMPGQLKLFLAR